MVNPAAIHATVPFGHRLRNQLNRHIPEYPKLRIKAIDNYFNGEAELRLLPYFCDPSKLSIDVGANIGVYAFFMARYSAAVVAYEPNPGLAANLRRSLPAISVREAAVSDQAGTLTLRIPIIGGRLAHARASVSQDFDYAERVESHDVAVAAIDGENLANVGFIKIDVEQHEIAVLDGARRTIERDRPVILTECTPLLYPKPLGEMFQPITGLGYTGFFSFQGGYLPLATFDPARHAAKERYGTADFMDNNLIFLPNGWRCTWRSSWWSGKAQRTIRAMEAAARH